MNTIGFVIKAVIPSLSSLKDPFQGLTLAALAGRVATGFAGIVAIMFVGLLMWGGYKYLTSEGDQGKVKQATAIITSALIGLVITLGAFLIKGVIYKVLGIENDV